MTRRIVLFDGICEFCNWSVQFIIQRDPNALFSFASLQSEVGQALLTEHGLPLNTDSIVLLENEQHYVESTAILKITRHLHRLYPLLYAAIIIPQPVRNRMYRFIANHRYAWFGKTNKCTLPSKDVQSRFLS